MGLSINFAVDTNGEVRTSSIIVHYDTCVVFCLEHNSFHIFLLIDAMGLKPE